MYSDETLFELWKQAKKCNCGKPESVCNKNSHRLCPLCNKPMHWGAHESKQPTSKYAWNVDHIKALGNKGQDTFDNLQVVHVECNRKKADY